jgi:hypothetical protein
MKRISLAVGLMFILLANAANAQFGVGIHQSNLPFVAFSYELNDKWLPELRFGTDSYFSDLGIEAVVNYKIKSTEEMDFYAGLGGRFLIFDGIVVPVGVNIYPFQKKSFGFHMELAGLIPFDDGAILRGTWGIKYRFLE